MPHLDVFADIACPWCLVGRRNLDAALRAWDGPEVVVRHRAFQLDPTLPPEGVPYVEHLARKFGGRDRVESAWERLRAVGAEVGVDFRMDLVGKAPNTRLAHGVVAVARTRGDEDAVLDAVFTGYFTRGRDVTDPAGLVAALEDAGIPDAADLVAAAVAGEGAASVTEDLALGRRIGVSSVPLFVVDGRLALVGAHPPENLLQLLAAEPTAA